jgi:hypothetical protein
MATARKSNVSTASQWKKSAVGGVEITVPSGNVCLAKRVDLRTFMKKGVIPNSLMPFVQDAIKGKKSTPEEIMEKVNEDGDLDARLTEMMELMDHVVCECVIEPKVHPIPKVLEDGEESDRDPDLLYIDEVDDMDKTFLFQWAVGGSSDLERFRTEQGDYVERLQSGEGNARQTV